MFCPACGNNVAADERFCRVCGKELQPSATPTAQAPMPTAGTAAVTSGKAIASLVCGLFLFAFPLSILAIVFGHLSLSDIRKSAGRLKGEGLAITGLVLGYLGVVAIPFLLIIAAIAIPNLLRARMAANESSAVASVRTLASAELAYSTSHPEAGYTCALSDLASAGLIDAQLASGQSRGYTVELQECGGSAKGSANLKYRVWAYPQTQNTTGTRSFCADESGMIKTIGNGSAEDCMQKGASLE